MREWGLWDSPQQEGSARDKRAEKIWDWRTTFIKTHTKWSRFVPINTTITITTTVSNIGGGNISSSIIGEGENLEWSVRVLWKTKILAHIPMYLPPSSVAPNKNSRQHEDSQPESIVQQIISSSLYNWMVWWLSWNF